jgi:hypothetical protein
MTRRLRGFDQTMEPTVKPRSTISALPSSSRTFLRFFAVSMTIGSIFFGCNQSPPPITSNTPTLVLQTTKTESQIPFKPNDIRGGCTIARAQLVHSYLFLMIRSLPEGELKQQATQLQQSLESLSGFSTQTPIGSGDTCQSSWETTYSNARTFILVNLDGENISLAITFVNAALSVISGAVPERSGQVKLYQLKLLGCKDDQDCFLRFYPEISAYVDTVLYGR